METLIKYRGVLATFSIMFMILFGVFVASAGVFMFDLFKFLWVNEPMAYGGLHFMGYTLMVFGVMVLVCSPYISKARKAEREHKASIIKSEFEKRLERELDRRKSERVKLAEDGGIL